MTSCDSPDRLLTHSLMSKLFLCAVLYFALFLLRYYQREVNKAVYNLTNKQQPCLVEVRGKCRELRRGEKGGVVGGPLMRTKPEGKVLYNAQGFGSCGRMHMVRGPNRGAVGKLRKDKRFVESK